MVRKAVDRQSGREVAVKFLAPDPKYIEPSSFDDVAALVAGDGMKRLSLADRAVVVLARHLH